MMITIALDGISMPLLNPFLLTPIPRFTGFSALPKLYRKVSLVEAIVLKYMCAAGRPPLSRHKSRSYKLFSRQPS